MADYKYNIQSNVLDLASQQGKNMNDGNLSKLLPNNGSSLASNGTNYDKHPVIDMTKNATVPVDVQVNNMIQNSGSERSKDIQDLVRNEGTIYNIIKNHGVPDYDQSIDFPSYDDMQYYYQDLYSPDFADNTRMSNFLRAETLYSMVTGSTPDNTDPFNMKGLFTDIQPNQMAGLYEVMYNRPMNTYDYHDYLMYGYPKFEYMQENESTEITNDNGNNYNNMWFNAGHNREQEFERRVVDTTYDDSQYDADTGTPDSGDIHYLNPVVSWEAPKFAYDEINNVLQVGIGQTIPIEAAIYFTSINMNNDHQTIIPKVGWEDFGLDKQPFSFQNSELAVSVLSHVINRITVTYGEMSHSSIIYQIVHSKMKYDHIGIYDLIRQTMLSLYCLMFVLTHKSYMEDMQYKDLQRLRANLKYLSNWCGHYGRYRWLVEFFEDLSTSVGYAQQRLGLTLRSTDLRFNLGSIKDNYN